MIINNSSSNNQTNDNGLVILSLFDGISCGQVAINRAGFNVKQYYASEIDKYPMQVTVDNYPNTIQLGDIRNLNEDNLPKNVDIVIGGSPCQSFSFSGKRLGMSGMESEDSIERIEITTLNQYLDLKDSGFIFEGQSYLFWEYMRVLNIIKPKYFLLENVVMLKKWEDIISNAIGVKPILINSSLVSAQQRKRLYWTNIPNITQPIDKNITWGDVREHNVEWSPMYYSDAAMEWIGKHGTRKGKKLKIHRDDEKMQMIEASHCKKYSSQRFFGIIDNPNEIKDRYVLDSDDNIITEQPSQILGRRLNGDGKRDDYNKNIKATQCLEVRGGDKVNCLTTVRKDNVIS